MTSHIFLTPCELAAACGVCRATVALWCRAGMVPGARKTLGGHWRVPAAAAAALTGAALPAARAGKKVRK